MISLCSWARSTFLREEEFVAAFVNCCSLTGLGLVDVDKSEAENWIILDVSICVENSPAFDDSSEVDCDYFLVNGAIVILASVWLISPDILKSNLNACFSCIELLSTLRLFSWNFVKWSIVGFNFASAESAKAGIATYWAFECCSQDCFWVAIKAFSACGLDSVAIHEYWGS